jgi:serine/threonine protein kinase
VIKQSGAEVVKVVDFGIATQTGGQNSARLTAPGMVLGTAEYMAPEQAQGLPVDHRLDQYALGCIMWEMLTGRVPFDGGHPTATMLKHLTDRPRPPSEIVPNLRIPPELDQIVLRTMSKDPASRYPSMSELEEALANQFAQLKQRSPSTAGLQLVRMPSTTNLPTRLFAVVSLGVVLIFGGAMSLRWLLQKRSGIAAARVVAKAPTLVHWRIDSQPQGAEVYSVSDGRKLGVTPWLSEETMDSGQIAIELRKSGFVSKQIVLSRSTDEDRTESLAPRKESKSSRKKDGSSGSSSSKRRKTKENSQVDLIID